MGKKSVYEAKPAAIVLLLLLSCGALLAGALPEYRLFSVVLFPLGAALLAYTRVLTGSLFVYAAVVPAYVAAGLISHSFLSALTVVIGAAGAVVLSLYASSPLRKAQLVMRVALGMGILTLVCFLLQFANEYGTVTPAHLREVFENGISEWTEVIAETFRQLLAALPEDAVSQFEGIYNEQTAQALVNTIASILPGAAVLLTELMAYLCVCFFRLTAKICRTPALTQPSPYCIAVNPATGLLYMISYLVIVFTTGDGTAIPVSVIVCSNLCIIVAPGLLLSGLNILRFMLSSPALSRARIPVLIVGILLFLFSPTLVFSILILIGVWSGISGWLLTRRGGNRS